MLFKVNANPSCLLGSMLLSQPIIDAIGNPIILKNDHGVILSCNQAFLRLRNCPANKIIGFTAHDFLSQREADCHAEADKALLGGCDGFMQYNYTQIDGFRQAPPRNVYKSIVQDPADGSRKILVVIGGRANLPTSFMAGIHLTQRENAVLELLVRGCSQKQIAQHLMISHHTVADYCKTIYQKLGVNSRTEAQMIAITKLGVLPQEIW